MGRYLGWGWKGRTSLFLFVCLFVLFCCRCFLFVVLGFFFVVVVCWCVGFFGGGRIKKGMIAMWVERLGWCWIGCKGRFELEVSYLGLGLEWPFWAEIEKKKKKKKKKKK